MTTAQEGKDDIDDLSLTEQEENLFVSRLHRCLDGIWVHRDWYCGEKFKIVLRNKMRDNSFYLYAKELSALMPRITKKLLSQPDPPTPDQMKSIDIPRTKDLAQYFVLVLRDTGVWELYSGSATSKDEGFRSRYRTYINGDASRPLFIRLHDSKDEGYTMFGPVPMFFAPRTTEALAESGINVLLVESIMMLFMRSLPSGGGFDKILVYSPFTEAQAWWSRRNTRLSLREWREYADLTAEENKEVAENTRISRNKRLGNKLAGMPEEEAREWVDQKNAHARETQMQMRTDRTEEQKAEDSEARGKARARKVEAMNEDEKLEMNTARRERRHRSEAKMTEEEKEAKSAYDSSRKKKFKANLTDEERTERNAKAAAKAKEKKDVMTDEERKAFNKVANNRKRIKKGQAPHP